MRNKVMDHSMAMQSNKERKVVGFFQQIRIILWKNTLLMLKNKVGTILELLLPLLFMGALFLIVYLDSEEPSRHDNKNKLNNPITDFRLGLSSNATYLYYPDNELAKSIVMDSIETLRKYFRIGLNGDDCVPYCDFRINGKLRKSNHLILYYHREL